MSAWLSDLGFPRAAPRGSLQGTASGTQLRAALDGTEHPAAPDGAEHRAAPDGTEHLAAQDGIEHVVVFRLQNKTCFATEGSCDELYIPNALYIGASSPHARDTTVHCRELV